MGVNLRLLVVVLGLRSLLVVQDVLLGPLGVRGVDQLLLAKRLFAITNYYRGQSAKMHKSIQIRSKSQENLLYRVDHVYIYFLKLINDF